MIKSRIGLSFNKLRNQVKKKPLKIVNSVYFETIYHANYSYKVFNLDKSEKKK